MAVFTATPASDVLASPGHLLKDGDRVYLRTSGTLPAPLALETLNHVRDRTNDTFKLSATAGGLAIDIVDAGAGVHVVRRAEVQRDCSELFEDVRDYFALQGYGSSVVFGWRETTKQSNQGAGRANRVVFVPGDESGKAGKMAPPKKEGRRRQIATHKELFQVRVWGYDPAAPNDERAQYRATRALYDLVLNGIREAACGRHVLGDPTWTTSPVERVFGKELVVTVTLDVPVLRTRQAVVLPPPALAPEPSASLVFPSGEVDVCPPTP